MLSIIMDYRMVPQLSALSLALCHEVLEGGGYQQMGTIISQKETSPLAHSVRNSLPHKSHRFCSPMRKKWSQYKETIFWETIFPPPLAHFIRNSLPRCAPQCEKKMEPI